MNEGCRATGGARVEVEAGADDEGAVAGTTGRGATATAGEEEDAEEEEEEAVEEVAVATTVVEAAAGAALDHGDRNEKQDRVGGGVAATVGRAPRALGVSCMLRLKMSVAAM